MQQITARAWETGGFLLPTCHGIMHTVARDYAHDRRVTLATLMDYLPQTNDAGCPAEFAHGLVTAVAPEIDAAEPAKAAAVCAEAGTRYQRYSCTHGFGHAFMRMHGDELGPALAMCRALGPNAAPDCDRASDPEVQIGLCAELPAADAESSIRGTKVQNLLGATIAEYVELTQTCDLFGGRTRAACYRWLGKTISVVTDGTFGERGCPQLRDPRARRACAAGARRIDDALVTFR